MTEQNKIKILLLAPGALHSTYDVYQYYLDAFNQRHDLFDVSIFSYHNFYGVHKEIVDKMKPDLPDRERATIATSRAARECLLEIALFAPDFVFSISGIAIPKHVWAEMVNLRDNIINKYGIINYFTESPYLDDMQLKYARYCDLVYLNDKYSLPKFDPDNSRYVTYLPHSYNPKIHFAGKVDEEYKSDLLFCGTPFYERSKILSELNFDNINFKLFGFDKYNVEPEHYKVLQGYTNSTNNDYGILDNKELAKHYRGAKVSLNIHRTRSEIDKDTNEINNYTDAYSVGPRLYEIAACGSLIITDYRKEAEDLFGDSVVFFEGSDQLQEKISYWTDDANAVERQNMIDAAQKRIKDCAFINRLNDIIIPDILEVQHIRR